MLARWSWGGRKTASRSLARPAAFFSRTICSSGGRSIDKGRISVPGFIKPFQTSETLLGNKAMARAPDHTVPYGTVSF